MYALAHCTPSRGTQAVTKNLRKAQQFHKMRRKNPNFWHFWKFLWQHEIHFKILIFCWTAFFELTTHDIYPLRSIMHCSIFACAPNAYDKLINYFFTTSGHNQRAQPHLSYVYVCVCTLHQLSHITWWLLLFFFLNTHNKIYNVHFMAQRI